MNNRSKKWINGFSYAYEGLMYTTATQRHMQIHVFLTLIILSSALALKAAAFEQLLLLLTVTLVMAAECMNTAVEKAVDLAMPEEHPWAKIAKDTAAASVLLTAVFAVASGVYVLGEKVIYLLSHQAFPPQASMGALTSVVMLYMVFILTLAVQVFVVKHDLLQSYFPSLGFSLLSSLLCITVYIISKWEYFGMIVVLYFIVAGFRIRQKHAVTSITSGTLLGLMTTIILLWMYNL